MLATRTTPLEAYGVLVALVIVVYSGTTLLRRVREIREGKVDREVASDNLKLQWIRFVIALLVLASNLVPAAVIQPVLSHTIRFATQALDKVWLTLFAIVTVMLEASNRRIERSEGE